MMRYEFLETVESNARTYATTFRQVFESGRGVRIRDSRGREFIDCLACAGALPLGHNHPEVHDAVLAFLASGQLQQALDLSTPAKFEFVQELFALLPPELRDIARIQFCGPSGSDAVEAAMKLTRFATKRHLIMAFHGAYHGMTSGALSAMGNLLPKSGIGLLAAGVSFAPYPDPLHCPFGSDGKETDRLSINYLRTILTDPESGTPKPAAVILEVVQGEGGCIPVSAEWLRELRQLTIEQQVPLIIDEVQTGLGRTGRMFSFQHAGITPDVVILSKAVGGGYPLSVVVYDRALDLWPPGMHAGTFRGNQIAMVAGRATMEIIRRDRLDEHAGRMGALLVSGLGRIAQRHPILADVRGRGLMVGAEVARRGRGSKLEPADGELAKRIKMAAFDNGILVETGGRHGAVLRFLPPLIVTESDVGAILDRFETALKSVVGASQASPEHQRAERVSAPESPRSDVESSRRILFLIVDSPVESPYEPPQLDRVDEHLTVCYLAATDAAACARRTIQGIAADLVLRIREVQPTGPYRVAGHSLAGMLAYGVAVQLLGEDEEVEFLGVVCSEMSPATTTTTGDVSGGAVEGNQRARPLNSAALEYYVPSSPLLVHLFAPAAVMNAERNRGWLADLPADQVRTVAVPATSEELSHDWQAVGRALSQSVRRAEGERRTPVDGGYVPLVTIQAGARDVPPCFCVPGAGANVTDFVALTGALGEQIPVHGLQPRGMNGVLLPHTSVAAASRSYLRELNRICPRGDVRLVGHSFGGWVAFDMALQLQAARRHVISLTLLDSDCPGGDGRVGREYTRPEALMNLVALYEQAAGRPLGVSLQDFQLRGADAQLEHLHVRLVRVGLMPARSTADAMRGPVNAFESAIRTQYRPAGTFQGVAKLVLVPGPDEKEEVFARRFDEVVAGWRSLAPHLAFCRGTGNHVTLLKQANIASVGAWILDEAATPPDQWAPACAQIDQS